MTESEQDGDQAERSDGKPAESESAPDGSAPASNSEDKDVSSLREELLGDIREADEAELADQFATRELKVETLQGEIEELQTTIEDKDEEIEDLKSRLKRKQADFQNYKKRMERKREDEKQRATEDLVERLLDVRDNLKRALEQDDLEDLQDGVESTFRQFESELDRENVAPIEPTPGDEVDPERHEVLARIESPHPEGIISDVHRAGYEMGEKVLRPAQVAVSDGSGETTADNLADEAESGQSGDESAEDGEIDEADGWFSDSDQG